MAAGIAGVIRFPQWDAALVFILLCGITTCTGHSIGMHRLLTHRSFEAPRWLEYPLVWLGTLALMGLARSIRLPASEPHRAGLTRI